ncbi:MAG TPA: hypothetical protein VGJ84_09535, partial [Polyangiaceae bacterium]
AGSGVGGSGVGGSSGSGTGGSAGVGGASGALCNDPDGLSPDTATTATGANGSFSDQCDSGGNLIEYFCEVVWDPGCFPNPDPSCRHLTGTVLPQNIDCAGLCVNGACAARCPEVGNTLQYLTVDASGNASIKNLTDGFSYQCTLIFDKAGGFNCKTIMSGGGATVVSLGLSDSYCTAAALGNIGVAPAGYSTEECAYSCTFIAG